MNLLVLPYPGRKTEIIRFVKKHHYSRRCPHVWSMAYAIENNNGKIQAVAMYGPAPYPTVARAFVRNQEHVKHHIWQSRMVSAGISSKEIDQLIYFANQQLLEQGYWWVHTLTNPTESLIEAGIKLICKGFTGDVYQRTGALYLGTAGKKALSGFLIDGKPIHKRQGAITLSLSNVHEQFPDANNIRPLYGKPKQRWAYILARTDAEREHHLLLMQYRPQEYQSLHQPRLLVELFRIWLLINMNRRLHENTTPIPA